jgi:hypothetical protein
MARLRQANSCLSVHTETPSEISRAKDIFTKAGAQDICTTGEASTPKDSEATHGEPQSTADSENLRRAA